jgi:hypothetical protein
MLIIPPPPFRKRNAKVKQQPVVAPPSTIVLAVYVMDNLSALWVFSSPVSVVDGPCAQLRIQTASGWQTAYLGDTSSPYLIACDYESGDLNTEGGDPWEIVTQPVGIGFGSAPLVLPQSGLTAR